jgi:RNA polymerase sigma-70 factor (ECF subfamily)
VPAPPVREGVQSYRDFLKIVADRALGSDMRCKLDSSDVVQDALLAVYREYDRFEDLPPGEFKALLVRVTLNQLRSMGRKYRGALKRQISREVSLESLKREGGSPLGFTVREVPPDEHLAERERVQRLRVSLARLPERERTAVTWRAMDDRTFREIGKRLGCSAVAARKLWLRVVEQLRRELSDMAT